MNEAIEGLINSTTYETPVRYISGRITEYDIKSANITMLHKYGKISDRYYKYLSALPKFDREKEIGLLIRNDYSYYDCIKNGISEAKRMLFESNNIQFDSVVRIANDAVYVNSSVDLQYTIFDNVVFKQKSIYQVMMKLSDLIIFFRYNIDGDYDLDVIGINNDKLELHSAMLSVIANVIHLLERVSPKDAIQYIDEFYIDYINFNLPKEFYRELNAISMYRYNYTKFYLSDIQDVHDIDINYNLYLLRELYAIALEKFNLRKS